METETKSILILGEIIYLCETWSATDKIFLPKFLHKHKQILVSNGTNNKQKERASRGIACLIKTNTFCRIKELNKTNLWLFIDLEKRRIMHCRYNLLEACSLNDNACLKMLNEKLKLINNLYSNYNILGDFNAKIESLNQLEEDIMDNLK